MDVDVADAKEAKTVETLKKPVKQVAAKKEMPSEDKLSDLLSSQSLVWTQWKPNYNHLSSPLFFEKNVIAFNSRLQVLFGGGMLVYWFKKCFGLHIWKADVWGLVPAIVLLS